MTKSKQGKKMNECICYGEGYSVCGFPCPIHNPAPTKPMKNKEAWIKEFDIKTSVLGLDGEQMDEIRDFIRQLLIQERKEVVLAIDKNLKPYAIEEEELKPTAYKVIKLKDWNKLKSKLKGEV